MESQQSTTQNQKLHLTETRELPKWRLYLMRGLYLLTFVGLAFDSWSIIFFPEEQMDAL